MKTSHALLGIIVATGLSIAGPAWSADAVDHAAHHRGGTVTAPAPTTGSGMPGGMSGMGQNNGMMGGNMMAMMGSMMPMMSGMMSSHVEGRLAFLKTELKITADQSAAWDRFADAYRAAGTSMHAMQGSMMAMMQGDLPSRFAAHQKMMSAHLDAMKAISGPLDALYAVLSADQKKSADDLIGMGM